LIDGGGGRGHCSRGNVAEFRRLWDAAQHIAVNDDTWPTQVRSLCV
jgi:hypothetical protein